MFNLDFLFPCLCFNSSEVGRFHESLLRPTRFAHGHAKALGGKPFSLGRACTFGKVLDSLKQLSTPKHPKRSNTDEPSIMHLLPVTEFASSQTCI